VDLAVLVPAPDQPAALLLATREDDPIPIVPLLELSRERHRESQDGRGHEDRSEQRREGSMDHAEEASSDRGV
jgi:hypothetical protein